MTYLSRVLLNPLRRQTSFLIQNPQRLHAAILGGLVDSTPDAAGRVLWRRENLDHRVELLILTHREPSWEHLIEQAGWPGSTDGAPLVRDYQPVVDCVMLGRQFTFRLTVNPSYTSREVQKPSGSQSERLGRGQHARLGHRTGPQQAAWFTAAAESGKWGFSVVGVPRLSGREHVRFSPGTGRGNISFDLATFEGLLEVRDVAQFTHSLLHGIGRGKAYGAGLLTLAPPGAGHVVES